MLGNDHRRFYVAQSTMRMSAASVLIKNDLLDPLASQATAVTVFEIFFEKVKVLVITFHMSLYTTP